MHQKSLISNISGKDFFQMSLESTNDVSETIDVTSWFPEEVEPKYCKTWDQMSMKESVDALFPDMTDEERLAYQEERKQFKNNLLKQIQEDSKIMQSNIVQDKIASIDLLKNIEKSTKLLKKADLKLS